MKNQLRFAWLVTFLLCPFQFAFLNWKDEFLIQFSKKNGNHSFDFHSDSLEIWFTIPFLFLLGWGLGKWNHRRIHTWRLEEWTAWSVAVVLLYYGADKIKLEQFPSPEVNLLYKPLHEFDKDLLFWTSMGTSSLFNWISGLIELLSAVLLIFPSSRKIGWILSTLEFGFILTINLSFNIHVKAFVLFLLLICILESGPWFQRVIIYLWDRQKTKHKWIFIRLLAFNLLAVATLYNFQSNEEIEEHIYQHDNGYLFISKQGFWIEKNKQGLPKQARIIDVQHQQYWLQTTDGRRIYRELKKEGDAVYSTTSLSKQFISMRELPIPSIDDPLTFIAP